MRRRYTRPQRRARRLGARAASRRSGLLDAEPLVAVLLQEGARLDLELPAVRQVAIRPLQEPREQVRGLRTADPVLVDHGDRVRACRQLQPADLVVVLDPEGARTDHLALARMTAAAATAAAGATGALDVEALLRRLLEAGLLHVDLPPVRELAVVVLEELREQLRGPLAAQRLRVGDADLVAAGSQLKLADVVVVQNSERVRALRGLRGVRPGGGGEDGYGGCNGREHHDERAAGLHCDGHFPAP